MMSFGHIILVILSVLSVGWLWDLPDGATLFTIDEERANTLRTVAASRLWEGEALSLASQHKLRRPNRTHRLFEGRVVGSESVAVSADGGLTMLDKYGYIYHATANNEGGYTINDQPPLYCGPGRPLGFHHHPNGRHLIVADSLKGLVEVDMSSGELRVLSNSFGGSPINYVNDLDIAPFSDGAHVYFTSSTSGVVGYNYHLRFYDTMRAFLINMISGEVSGRVFKYDYNTKSTELVLEGLWYANGIAVSEDESYILVVETMGLRIHRHWLAGSNKGRTEVFMDNLPGFPDGISRAPDGNFWVAIVAPRSPLLPYLPFKPLRWLLGHLALNLGLARFIAKKIGCAIKVSPEGKVLDVLLDPTGEVAATISAVTEHDGRVFLGNLGGNFVSVHDLDLGG